MALEKGAVVDGIVTGITNFGAFVELLKTSRIDSHL